MDSVEAVGHGAFLPAFITTAISMRDWVPRIRARNNLQGVGAQEPFREN